MICSLTSIANAVEPPKLAGVGSDSVSTSRARIEGNQCLVTNTSKAGRSECRDLIFKRNPHVDLSTGGAFFLGGFKGEFVYGPAASVTPMVIIPIRRVILKETTLGIPSQYDDNSLESGLEIRPRTFSRPDSADWRFALGVGLLGSYSGLRRTDSFEPTFVGGALIAPRFELVWWENSDPVQERSVNLSLGLIAAYAQNDEEEGFLYGLQPSLGTSF